MAPIIIFCYKRLDTLTQCVKSLTMCPESSSSDLIVISDAPANEEAEEKVTEVRNYIKTITGFKSLEIIERPKNLGVDYNIINGIGELCNRFENFIIVEDDIVVALDFLNYLNKSLAYYKDNPAVLTVAAFSYVKKIPLSYNHDVYFASRTNPWGWASWSEKMKKVDWLEKPADQELFLNSPPIQKQFNEWGSDRSSMLTNTLTGKIRAWDIRLDYSQFLNNQFTVYPTQNLSINIGFGREDASNTFGYNRYKVELKATRQESFNFLNTIKLDEHITKEYKKMNSLSKRIFTRLMKIVNVT